MEKRLVDREGGLGRKPRLGAELGIIGDNSTNRQ
jgi:hypothetical protein